MKKEPGKHSVDEGKSCGQHVTGDLYRFSMSVLSSVFTVFTVLTGRFLFPPVSIISSGFGLQPVGHRQSSTVCDNEGFQLTQCAGHSLPKSTIRGPPLLYSTEPLSCRASRRTNMMTSIGDFHGVTEDRTSHKDGA
jgi:hypothetical protein